MPEPSAPPLAGPGSATADVAGDLEILPFWSRIYCSCKRIIDIIAAASALFILAVPLLLLGVVIRMKLGSPIFFTQHRPGLHGRIFRVVKFRSMSEARDSSGNLLPDVERLPPFGRFLRAASLDELPQLWCVLCGDMSLIGPRPLLIKYLPLYSAKQRRRHLVRPGITGLAQVNGRNVISWQAKFDLDVWYVDHLSPLLDVRILALTALRVLARDGVNRPGFATTVEFAGNPISNENGVGNPHSGPSGRHNRPN